MPAVVVGGPTGRVEGGEEFPVLVETEEDWSEFFETAAELMEGGEHERAVRILQAMTERSEGGFVQAEGRRYVGLAERAAEILDKLPPAGKRLYRGLYDGQAEHLYEQSLRTGRTGPLHRIVNQFSHTSYGAKAYERLGSMYFDRGRFAEAARSWRAALARPDAPSPAPALLARVAAALHLAGDREAAQAALARLEKDHPDATGSIAGEERDLAAHVREVFQAPAPKRRRVLDDWPGVGGVADGQGIMSGGDIILSPKWVRPKHAARPISASLVAEHELRIMRARGQWVVTHVRGGKVSADVMVEGRRQSSVDLSARVHPLIVDGAVIYRTDGGVQARDLLTGESLWQAHGLPLHRASQGNTGGLPASLGDAGLYQITAGGGKVFVRYGFVSRQNTAHVFGGGIGWAGPVPPPGDSAKPAHVDRGPELVALGVSDGGFAWGPIGNGHGDDEVIRAGVFASPPTYHQGRLYIVSLHLERFHLICLDARNGELLWRRPVCHSPAIGHPHAGMDTRMMLARVSPPAVSDGRVLVVTNSGIAAALDAETGQPLWANHYSSTTNSAGRPGHIPTGSLSRSVNPLIVCGDRLVCLPTDSENLLAYSVADGELLWSVAREGQQQLSAVGPARLLLSSPGLVVKSTADGDSQIRHPDSLGVHGRPAVLADRVRASADGELISLHLGTKQISHRGLTSADGLLGNLVSCEQALVAANAAGVCAYFSFEDVRNGLVERMETAEPRERARLWLTLGQVAFNAGEMEMAADDFERAGKLARELELPVLAGHARSWGYRTAVAIATRAGEPGRMVARFEQVMALAATKQEKAHTLLRLAKSRENAGELAAAAELIEKLREEYGDEEIVDVGVGPSAEDKDRLGKDDATHKAADLAHRFLRRLIERHGREFYEAVEKRAAEALAAARKSGEPSELTAVRDRWPNSRAANGALYAAAEIHYERGRERDDAEGREHVKAARELLSKLCRVDEPVIRLSAGTVLAVIYQREGHVNLAADRRRAVEADPDYDASLKVEFADIAGPAGELLRSLEHEPDEPAEAARALGGLPLAEAWSIGPEAVLARDQDGRAVRVGDRIVVLRGNEVLLLDPSASDSDTAVVWRGRSPGGPSRLRDIVWGRRLVFGFSNDVVVVAQPGMAYGFEADTGKRLWRRKVGRDLGMDAVRLLAVDAGLLLAGEGRLEGAVDTTTGEVLQWRARPVRPRRQRVRSVQAAAGVAVVEIVRRLEDPDAEIDVFDLASGKLLSHWRTQRLGWSYLTDDGVLALMLDGELSVRAVGTYGDAPSVGEPIWVRKVGGPGRLVAAEGGRFAVRTDRGLEVLSISGEGAPELGMESASGACALAGRCAYASSRVSARSEGASLLEGVSVDGLAGDWEDAGLRVDDLRGGGAPGTDDVSSEFRIAWSEKGLLVLADVRDDHVYRDARVRNLYDTDSIEVFVRADVGAAEAFQVVAAPCGGSLPPPMGSGGRRAAATPGGLAVDLYRPGGEFGHKEPLPPVQCAAVVRDGGYSIELMIPWSALDVEPGAGANLAMQLYVNDLDRGEGKARLAWHPSVNAHVNPRACNPVTLLGKPTAAAGHPVLRKWSPRSRRPDWTAPLPPGASVESCVASGSHVVVALSGSARNAVCILDAETGEELQSLAAEPPRWPVGRPVVAAGRLLMETRKGVTVYAPKD